MQPLQNNSLKIKKDFAHRNGRTFICGGCECAYRSYPALYLHIKRKHNGIRPANTKTTKLVRSHSTEKAHTGRPQKPSLDVDNISENRIYIEQAQNDLLNFLGENLKIVTGLSSKPKLESVAQEILQVSCPTKDEEQELSDFKKKVEEVYVEIKRDKIDSFEIELDFETFCELDKTDCLKVLCWFLVWLGRNVVKLEALKDLTIILSKVWICIMQKGLGIPDLDNKLVWNGVLKACEPCLSSLNHFRKNKEVVYEFIKKLCHLIGKIFDK